jgi:hypothetical protein
VRLALPGAIGPTLELPVRGGIEVSDEQIGHAGYHTDSNSQLHDPSEVGLNALVRAHRRTSDRSWTLDRFEIGPIAPTRARTWISE